MYKIYWAPARKSKPCVAASAQQNQLSVRLELQADWDASVWTNDAQEMRNILEPGDIEEALAAAVAVGDDSIQQATHGIIVPERVTHGSAAQRRKWFNIGIKTGNMRQCNTFAASNM